MDGIPLFLNFGIDRNDALNVEHDVYQCWKTSVEIPEFLAKLAEQTHNMPTLCRDYAHYIAGRYIERNAAWEDKKTIVILLEGIFGEDCLAFTAPPDDRLQADREKSNTPPQAM